MRVPLGTASWRLYGAPCRSWDDAALEAVVACWRGVTATVVLAAALAVPADPAAAGTYGGGCSLVAANQQSGTGTPQGTFVGVVAVTLVVMSTSGMPSTAHCSVVVNGYYQNEVHAMGTGVVANAATVTFTVDSPYDDVRLCGWGTVWDYSSSDWSDCEHVSVWETAALAEEIAGPAVCPALAAAGSGYGMYGPVLITREGDVYLNDTEYSTSRPFWDCPPEHYYWTAPGRVATATFSSVI